MSSEAGAPILEMHIAHVQFGNQLRVSKAACLKKPSGAVKTNHSHSFGPIPVLGSGPITGLPEAIVVPPSGEGLPGWPKWSCFTEAVTVETGTIPF